MTRVLVVEDEESFSDALSSETAAAGSRRVKVEPVPSALQTVASPPWPAATCLTMDRPSPVPPVSRDLAASTR